MYVLCILKTENQIVVHITSLKQSCVSGMEGNGYTYDNLVNASGWYELFAF